MLPQEIELWYVIPALRKELAIALKGYGLNQKKVAKILQVSPSAVSQYFGEKRAKNIPFDKTIKTMIRESAATLTYTPDAFTQEIIRLTQAVKDSKAICQIHTLFDPNVKLGCNDCFMEDKK